VVAVYLQHDAQSPRTRVQWSTESWPAWAEGLKFHELHIQDGVRPEIVVESVLTIEDPQSSKEESNKAVMFLRGLTLDEPVLV
jgi:hypothetical protein